MSDPRERLREAQERAREAALEAQLRVREAQERASELAREAALDAQQRAHQVASIMPPGLLARLGSAAVGIFILFSSLFIEVDRERLPGLLFTCGMALVALRGASEYFTALQNRNFRPNERMAYVAVMVFQFAAWSVSQGEMLSILPVLLAVLAIITLVIQVVRGESELLTNLGVTVFGVIYVGWLMSYLIFIRSLPGKIDIALPFGATIHGAPRGTWLVLYVMAVTWMTDTGAYAIGMKFGKNSAKLAPKLSPNKTRIGAVGGLLFATATSVLWGIWVGLPWYHGLILGPVIGVLGQVGDLCESALKRDLGIKDFGGIMPGHGGVLDRFDSLLFTAPIAYYYLVLVIDR